MTAPSSAGSPMQGQPPVITRFLTFENQTFTASADSRILIAGQTLSPGGSPIVTAGTTIRLLANDLIAMIGSTPQTLGTVTTASSNQPGTSAKTVEPSESSSKQTKATSAAASSLTSDSNTSSSKDSNTTAKAHATSQAQSSKATSSPHSSASHDVSRGATAGIAIGSAAVGAIIAALLVFLFMRKRRNDTGSSQREYSPDEKSPASSKRVDAITRSLDPSRSPSAFALAENDLPLPLEDAAIGGETSRLQTLIKNFAQSYYHTSPAVGRSQDLSELGPKTPVPAETLAAMLADPRARISAICYCFLWTIVSRISLDCDPNESLLPTEVANCLQSMPAVNNTSGEFSISWQLPSSPKQLHKPL